MLGPKGVGSALQRLPRAKRLRLTPTYKVAPLIRTRPTYFAETETVVMRSKTGTVRRIKTNFRDIGARFIG
jgi:hypothetical protein